MSQTGGENDAALMRRVAAGDGAATRLVVSRHLPQVLALARRMLNDAAEAEDVAQDAMLRLWQMAPRWHEDAPVGAWLYRVAHNLAIDRIRRRRPTVDVEKAFDLADPAPNPAESLAERERKAFAEYVEKLHIKIYHHAQLARNLSGGNQQKVVLAKWLMRNAEVVIFDEPTRGIDVGAKYEIYLLMNELARQGKAILMISSELPEILGMSDRILVMHEGRVTGAIDDVAHATQEEIMELAVA